jgi:YihY family inner membrane protein
MPDVSRLLRAIDRFQQRHRPLAFGFGVIKKFGDDQGGNLAALMTYYGFLSLFPLLLVMVTVLSYVLDDNPDLQRDILNSALADFPVLGDQIRNNIGSVRGNGIGLIIGILVTFYGGLGIANSVQDAMNRVWSVPHHSRPGFFPRIARSLALIGVLGLGILFTTFLATVAAASGNVNGEVRVMTAFAAFVFNIGLFALAFKALTAKKLAWTDVLPGALIAAFGYGVLQVIGGALLTRQLKGMSETYGVFAAVIGLLLWIFLLARVTIYAAEVNAVRTHKLWPRSFNPPPLTDGDQRAFEMYARVEGRRKGERIHVELPEDEIQGTS